MTIRFGILVFFFASLWHAQARAGDIVVSNYTPAIDNLVLREEVGIHSKKIRLLVKTESVIFLEPGPYEIIENTPGRWIKVRTAKREEGWCFDGYLNVGGDIVSRFDMKDVPATKEVSRIDNPSLERVSYIIIQKPESFDGWSLEIAKDSLRSNQKPFLNMRRYILTCSRENNRILQVYSMPDHGDELSMELSREFGELMARIEFKLDTYHTVPISRHGVRFVRIGNDGLLKEPYLQYFVKRGSQDAPFAELTTYKKDNGILLFEYIFYESIGFPSYGFGQIRLIYDFSQSGVRLREIVSDVMQTEKYVKKWDNTVKLEKAEKLTYSKDSLNKLFDSKKYEFVF